MKIEEAEYWVEKSWVFGGQFLQVLRFWFSLGVLTVLGVATDFQSRMELDFRYKLPPSLMKATCDPIDVSCSKWILVLFIFLSSFWISKSKVLLISSSLFCWSLNLGSRWLGRGGTLCGSKGKESASTTGLLTTAERLRFGPSVSW